MNRRYTLHNVNKQLHTVCNNQISIPLNLVFPCILCDITFPPKNCMSLFNLNKKCRKKYKRQIQSTNVKYKVQTSNTKYKRQIQSTNVKYKVQTSNTKYKRQIQSTNVKYGTKMDRIRADLLNVNWNVLFFNLNVNEMTLGFTDIFFEIMSKHITHKSVTCNDKDATWIALQVKTVSKRNSRVYRKCVNKKSSRSWKCSGSTKRNK